MSLIHEGRRRGDVLVVSIYVNPLQFGPGEDLASYPRSPQRDAELCRAAGVDILFCGHVHTGRPVQVVDGVVDGIRIYRSPAGGNTSQLAERWPDADTRVGFHRCDVTSDGIDVTFVPGADQCEEFGTFGPWGHPSPEERDYSIAEEQPPLQADA